MSEVELHLEVPRWVYPLAVVTQLFTAMAAGYVYLGALVTLPVITAGTVALVLWLASTYRDPCRRGLLPLYLLVLALLLLQGLEQWHFGYASTVRQLYPASFAPPVVFDETIQLAVFTLAAVAVYLLGALGLFFHHPLGNYMAWFAMAQATAGGLALLAMAVGTGQFHYVPGMGTGLIGIPLGIAGGLRLARPRVGVTS